MFEKYIVPALITISSILTIVSVFPYLIDVLKRKTRPKVVTWFVWGLLTGISCIASVVECQWATAIMLGFSALASFAIMALGWKTGDKKFDRLDVFCLVCAIFGVVLWRLLDSPSAAVLIMIATDFIGGLPTTVHAWKKPNQETWQTFFMGLVGSVCTLLVIKTWQITSFAFPLFISANSLNVTLIIILRRLYLKKKTR